MTAVKVVSVVLCEEVRREASGGAFLVGARPSGPSIEMDKKTIIPRLALYIELEVSWPTPRIISVRLRNGKEDYAALEHEFELEPAPEFEEDSDIRVKDVRGVLVSVINEDNIEVHGPGVFSVQLKYDDQDWVTVRDYVFPALTSNEDDEAE